jgi:hypothetical protein
MRREKVRLDIIGEKKLKRGLLRNPRRNLLLPWLKSSILISSLF